MEILNILSNYYENYDEDQRLSSRRGMTEFLTTELPEAVYAPSEATYLAWVDLSAYFPEGSDLPDFFANQAGVLLEGGSSMFVDNADRCVRLNLAMPRAMLVEAADRIIRTICAAMEKETAK